MPDTIIDDIAALKASSASLEARVSKLEAAAPPVVADVPAPGPSPEPKPPAPAPDLITLTITRKDGTVLSFDEAAAVDRGSMRDPVGNRTFSFAEIAKYPFVVTIIRGGDVPDVVIAYGGASSDSLATAVGLTTSYAASAVYQGKTFSNVAPYHFWGSTWCLSLGEHAVVQSADQLKAARLVPNFDGKTSAAAPVALAYSPMGFSSISTYWNTGGDRDEIGLLTEWDACYLGSGQGLRGVLDTGEALGSFPHHLTIDGKPLNLENHPNLLTYSSFNQWSVPPIPLGDGLAPAGIPPEKFAMDIAHHPHAGYLAYQLTRRPYFLRRFQDQTTWLSAWSGANAHVICGDGQQVRGDAWILLSKLYCYLASPPEADCPAWLLPKEYWKRALDADGAWFDANMMTPTADVRPANPSGYYRYGPNVKNVRFHSATSVFETSFKEDYVGAVLGLIAYAGDLPDRAADLGAWKARFAWKAKFPIDRASGLTAWDNRFVSIYYLAAHRLDGVLTSNYDKLAAAKDSPGLVVVADLADLWESNKSLYDLSAPAGKVWVDPNLGPNPISYVAMQLTFAKLLGLPNPGLAEAYDHVVPSLVPSAWRFALSVEEAKP